MLVTDAYDNKSIIKRMQKVIYASGLTHAEIALSMGVTNTSLYNWQHGLSKPSVESLAKFSKLFGVSLDWLVFGKELSNGETN